ncbi:MAG: GNAT family N-acetyltransferase [Terracidiphilus sp.]|jgi:predicted GNAT superfamily acetyltransferase
MIAIRSCAGFDELQACVQLQIETWGIDASEVFPRRAFFLAQKIGGQVIGAFDTEIGRGADALVGYVLSWPGVKSGGGAAQPYLHSHMLAVRAAYRNRGIGAALKLDQRKEALSRGIRRMEWTFDPLEIKNAYLNLHKLGAIAYRYEENFYGVSSSRLQGGLPTDRLVAVWQLDSLRVEAAIEGRPAGVHEVMRRIPIPAAIYEWKASDAGRERALAVQTENRRAFQEAFMSGLTVIGFSRDAQGNGVFELGPLSHHEADLKFQGM